MGILRERRTAVAAGNVLRLLVLEGDDTPGTIELASQDAFVRWKIERTLLEPAVQRNQAGGRCPVIEWRTTGPASRDAVWVETGEQVVVTAYVVYALSAVAVVPLLGAAVKPFNGTMSYEWQKNTAGGGGIVGTQTRCRQVLGANNAAPEVLAIFLPGLTPAALIQAQVSVHSMWDDVPSATDAWPGEQYDETRYSGGPLLYEDSQNIPIAFPVGYCRHIVCQANSWFSAAVRYPWQAIATAITDVERRVSLPLDPWAYLAITVTGGADLFLSVSQYPDLTRPLP